MATQDFGLNLDGKLTLTERELDLLRAHAKSGDRVGFYMSYYNMTGNEGADNSIFGFAQRASSFLYVSKEMNQSTGNCSCVTSISAVHGSQKYIPQSSASHSLDYANNNRSALCHVRVTSRLKSTSCCFNPLLLLTLGLFEGNLAA